MCWGLKDKPSPLISYLPFLKNSVAAQSSASTTSVPSLKPAWSTDAAMKSSAARVEARFGAKPPSSPTAVARPFADRPFFSVWKISLPQRTASAMLPAPTEIGRESGRERVGQYVEIQVVAV